MVEGRAGRVESVLCQNEHRGERAEAAGGSRGAAEIYRQRKGRRARRHDQYIPQTDEQKVREDRVARVGRVLFEAAPLRGRHQRVRLDI